MEYKDLWKAKNREQKLINIIGKADSGNYKDHIDYEVEVVSSFIGEETELIMVDYGAGMGDTARAMAKLGHRVIAIDVSFDMVSYDPYFIAFQDNNREYCVDPTIIPSGKYVFMVNDGRSIPVINDSVDFIYSFLTLQHMLRKDVKLVLDDMRKVLKPSGHYLLQFSMFGNADYDGKGHSTVAWDAEQIEAILPGIKGIMVTGDSPQRYLLVHGDNVK